MMIRKQDSNGDFVFGLGSNSFFENTKEGVAQLILTRLRLWYAEWFADTTDGVPYAQDVLGKSSPSVYNSVIRRRVLQTPGVLEVTSFYSVMDRTTRKLTITLTANTVYGPVAVESPV